MAVDEKLGDYFFTIPYQQLKENMRAEEWKYL